MGKKLPDVAGLEPAYVICRLLSVFRVLVTECSHVSKSGISRTKKDNSFFGLNYRNRIQAIANNGPPLSCNSV